MIIVRAPLSRSELQWLADRLFGDFVKAVVDVERGVMAVDAELHADEEQALIEDGSDPSDLWGVNIYPGRDCDEMIEFDSLINVRPYHGNRSRGVDSAETRARIAEVVTRLVTA